MSARTVSPKALLAQTAAGLAALDGGDAEAGLRALFDAEPVTCRICRQRIALEGVHWVCRCAYPTLDPRDLGKTLAMGPHHASG